MHDVYKLKDMLCEELEEYGKKKDLNAGALDVVDKLAHTIKNLDKILENYEEKQDGYSSRGGSYGETMQNRGGSYARGRGRNAKRDAMGRYASEGRYSMEEYSRNDEMIDKLTDMMNDAPNEQTRQEIQRLINKMQMM